MEPIKKLYLSRAPIWRYQRKERKMGIDVTVQSAKCIWKSLAPTWKMVMGYKKHQNVMLGSNIKVPPISWEEYTTQYNEILDRVDWQPIIDQLDRWREEGIDEVVFLCFCKDGANCHTHLLIDRLIEMDTQGLYFTK